MKNSSSVPRNSNINENHPPLARDQNGNPVSVPDNTAAFAMKRETRGRPRLIIGPDRQAVRFALDTTPDDVEEMVGPGTYRVYALNEVGTLIDYVTTLVIGGDQDDTGDVSSSTQAAMMGAVRGPGSDLRFALETIRDTNRVLADSLKAVAAWQADWVKGLATAKALPRNAPAWWRFAQQPQEEDDDDEDETAAPAVDPAAQAAAQAAVTQNAINSTMGAVAKVAEAVTGITTTYNTIRNGRAAKKETEAEQPAKQEPPRNAAPASTPPESAHGRPNPMIHLAQINARLRKDERRFLNEVLCGEDGALVTEELLKYDVPNAVKVVRTAMRKTERQARDRADCVGPVASAQPAAPAPAPVPEEATENGAKDFMAHVMAVSAHLTAEERATVLWLFPKFPVDRLEQLKVRLLRMSAEDAAAWVKANLEALRAEVSS